MSLAVGGLFIHLYNSAEFHTRNYGLLVLFALTLFGAFYTLKRYINNAPSITVTNDFIIFNNSKYLWKDIEQIELTGKRPFKFMNEEREGVLLKFKNYDEKYIFDDMYENSSEIKKFIQQVVTGESFFELTKIDEVILTDVMTENFKYYKGIQFFCFEGMALWGLTLFFVYIGVLDYLRHHHNLSLVMPIILGIFMFIVFSRRMYYFGLSDKLLVIRNQNFLWIKKLVLLADVKEIVFEQRYRMPVTLRIINNDFNSKSYPAAAIWSKKWMMLKEDLEKKGIKVRNECVHYEPFEFKFFND